MTFKLALAAGLSLVASASQTDDTANPDGTTTPGKVTSTIAIERADESIALTIESDWSQAVFNSDFHAWLVNLVAKINAYLTQYLIDQQGPADQTSLESTLAAKLSFDPAANQVIIK